MDGLNLIAGSGIQLPPVFRCRHLINGTWRDSADGATSDRIAPAQRVVISVAAKGGVAEVNAAVAAAWAALPATTAPRLAKVPAPQ